MALRCRQITRQNRIEQGRRHLAQHTNHALCCHTPLQLNCLLKTFMHHTDPLLYVCNLRDMLGSLFAS
jgi:hypothetical protein